MVAGLLKDLVPDIATSMQNTKFAVGSTKVYFSSSLLQRLEDHRKPESERPRDSRSESIAWQVYRERFLRQRNAEVEIQTRTRGSFQARRYRILRTGMIKLQSLERGRKQRYLFELLLNRVLKERELDRERLRKDRPARGGGAHSPEGDRRSAYFRRRWKNVITAIPSR